jgi:hypothetical protein
MIGLSLAKPPIEFLFGVLTGLAVLLLDQTDELIGFATHPVQVVVGEFTPPFFDLTPHFLPLTFKYVFVQAALLRRDPPKQASCRNCLVLTLLNQYRDGASQERLK